MTLTAPAASLNLREALVFLENLLENGRDGLAAFDCDLKYVYWNPVMEVISGLPRDLALGKTAIELFPSIRQSGEDRNLLDALLGRPSVTRGRYFAARLTGRTRTFDAYHAPLHGPDGAIVGGFTLARNAAEQARIEQRLLESETRFRTMADCAPVLLWMSGIDSLCVFFNQTWLEFTGRTMAQELGVGWAEGVHPEDFQSCMDTYMEAFRARRNFEMVYRLRRRDGEYRWVLDTGTPRNTPAGEFAGYIGSCTDITDRKEAEETVRRTARQLARSNEELERFAYIASHDLQEPMRMVANYTELLARKLDGRLDDQAREYLNYAREGALRMRDLIRGILEISLVKQLDPSTFEPVDSGVVLNLARMNLELMIRESRAEILQEEKLPMVQGRADYLERLFRNLIHNALKFRGPSPPRVSVTAAVQGDSCRFTVRDNGIGFDPGYAEKAFVIFQRLHSREEFPGLGLGLALCRQIVEIHGGRIWLDSTPGDGTAVHFTLPVAPG